jgi:hypothetical protein
MRLAGRFPGRTCAEATDEQYPMANPPRPKRRFRRHIQLHELRQRARGGLDDSPSAMPGYGNGEYQTLSDRHATGNPYPRLEREHGIADPAKASACVTSLWLLA